MNVFGNTEVRVFADLEEISRAAAEQRRLRAFL